MIALLQGTIYEKRGDRLVLLVNGVGYAVFFPSRVLESVVVGQELTCVTYQHVREDALDLFGFIEERDRSVFQALIQVSGVGPKVGMSLLSAFSGSDLQRAIMTNDTALLSSVSGIGKKTAERIVLELQDAFTSAVEESMIDGVSESVAAVDALVSLGYSAQEAHAALKGVDSAAPVEEQIRQVLQQSA